MTSEVEIKKSRGSETCRGHTCTIPRRYSLSRTQCLSYSTKSVVALVMHQIHVNDVAPWLRAHMETGSVKQTLKSLTRDVLSQNVVLRVVLILRMLLSLVSCCV